MAESQPQLATEKPKLATTTIQQYAQSYAIRLATFITIFFLVEFLNDTGAFSSAMPRSTFQKLQRICPKSISNYNPLQSTEKVANRDSVTTFGTFKDSLKIAVESFTETCF